MDIWTRDWRGIYGRGETHPPPQLIYSLRTVHTRSLRYFASNGGFSTSDELSIFIDSAVSLTDIGSLFEAGSEAEIIDDGGGEY
jgi:hypothetical protein